MRALTVVGGLYRERCLWPEWNRLFGSGGRAAAALVGHVDDITFRTYASPTTIEEFTPQAAIDNLHLCSEPVNQLISFDYVHGLSTPVIAPPPPRIRTYDALDAQAEVVLRFGMLEGTGRVEADRCVYDPQSAFAPQPFCANESHAATLAIVGNRREICELGRSEDSCDASARLLEDGANVVVVKAGAEGAQVFTPTDTAHVPAYRTDAVWTLGSGDVFAAMFAASWGVHGNTAADAARLASAATAAYATNRELPIPPVESLSGDLIPATAVAGRVYLAGPFFTLSQRWLIEEVRQGLLNLGLQVFSPLHEVGPGPADEVAPADIAALERSDLVFAILDGLDSGTLFEVGYARAIEKPVYALAQDVPPEHLKMVEGSQCRVYDDLVTALHHAVWRE